MKNANTIPLMSVNTRGLLEKMTQKRMDVSQHTVCQELNMCYFNAYAKVIWKLLTQQTKTVLSSKAVSFKNISNKNYVFNNVKSKHNFIKQQTCLSHPPLMSFSSLCVLQHTTYFNSISYLPKLKEIYSSNKQSISYKHLLKDVCNGQHSTIKFPLFFLPALSLEILVIS